MITNSQLGVGGTKQNIMQAKKKMLSGHQAEPLAVGLGAPGHSAQRYLVFLQNLMLLWFKMLSLH